MLSEDQDCWQKNQNLWSGASTNFLPWEFDYDNRCIDTGNVEALVGAMYPLGNTRTRALTEG